MCFSLTPGFNRVLETPQKCETVLTVSRLASALKTVETVMKF
jgi:hypothetical protein